MVKRIMALRLSTLIIGAIAVTSFITVYSLLESFSWVNHTHEVLYQLHAVKNDVADCQTSVRETIFGEDKVFLNLYLSKSPGIEQELDTLQWLTRDNITQQKNIYDLRNNVGRRMAAFREVVDLFKEGKVQEAQKILKARFGEAWVQSTRNIVEIIESEERRLLDLRLRDYKQKSSLVLYGIPMLMIIYITVFNVSLASLLSKTS